MLQTKHEKRMKKLLTVIITLLLCNAAASAQTLQQQTNWLKTKLNTLVKDEELKLNDKKTPAIFDFDKCKMKMSINAKDEGFSLGMGISWLLQDIKKVTYLKQKDGYYLLALAVPADRIKVGMGFGDGNTLGGSFNVKNDDKDSKTDFTLNTKDENVVKEIAHRFEVAAKTCRM